MWKTASKIRLKHTDIRKWCIAWEIFYLYSSASTNFFNTSCARGDTISPRPGHHFQGQKVKVTRPLWLVVLAGQHRHTVMVTYPYTYMPYRVTTAGLQGGGISWRSPAYSLFEMKFCNAQNRIFPADSLLSWTFWRRFQRARIFSADKKWRLIRLSATAKGSTVTLTSLIHYVSFMSFSPFYGHHFTRQQRRLPDCRGKKTKRRLFSYSSR